MSRFFEPYISYRLDEKGGGVRDFGFLSSGGLLSQYRTIVFFVHGYNNDQQDASAAYTRFLKLLGPVSGDVIGVYWPGDNWTSAAYYMQAVNKVGSIAYRFARDIHTAALGSGSLEISFVAHSLGCRVTLETIRELRELLRKQPAVGLKVRRAIFMAGAVPTSFLENPQPLNKAIQDLRLGAKSLYSAADRVLHYAFPTGETLAGQSFFPTALGRTEWLGGAAMNPAMQQKENATADHSDYWGAGSTNAESLKTAATEVNAFISLGGPKQPRTVPLRATTTRPGTPARAGPTRTV